MCLECGSRSLGLGTVFERSKLVFIRVFEDGDLLPSRAIGKLRPRFLPVRNREKGKLEYLFDIEPKPEVERQSTNQADGDVFVTKCTGMVYLIVLLCLRLS